MKLTEADFNSQVEALRDTAARSIDSCLVAKFIALSDERVRKLIFLKLKQKYVFKGIYCLNLIGIPEYKYVHFAFECPPEIFCLINPSFVAVVDFVNGEVVSIIDPYIPSSSPSNELPPQIFKTWIHSFEEDSETVRVYRAEGHDFPPSFFRENMTFKQNREFLLTIPGPTDIPETIAGTWTARGRDYVTVTFEGDRRDPLTMQILSVDGHSLKVRRL